ncbi:hypothetical protein [Microtetraspora malaysiensis]|uniref:hypothetical protein n=1 Tax=Microtetraspora malaysiensis TaxID=161358 RepID=UPI003D8CA99B
MEEPALAPLAVASCLPLVVSALEPGIAISAAAWFLTGVLSAYQVITNAEFVRFAPPERRGQTIGVAASALTAVQGVGGKIRACEDFSWVGCQRREVPPRATRRGKD